jgi:tetrahydromethanopterin S-methyltransferase subunit H
MPLYRPNPAISDEEDGLHIMAITESLIKPAERCKDYDDTGNPMLLVSIQGLLAKHRRLVMELERKVERLIKEEAKNSKAAVRKATRVANGSPFGRLV